MKKRGDRTMTDLYDRTQKIPRLKVLSIEGSTCKEPLDQPVNETGGINENNKSPSRKRSISDDDNPCSKPESGTCNVCNTPCTSCLHRMRVETDTCSFVGTCSEHSSCEDAETKSKSRNSNKTKPFDIGIVKQEGQGESTSCVTKYTKEKDTQKIDSHRESSSVNCKEESQEKKMFNLTDSQEKSNSNFRVPQNSSARSENMFGGLENFDKRDFSEKDQMQAQKVVELKNQETDNGLIDVKVCDICGDTGREELLAACTRCIDGAEHTYCMRVRLEKLPEGDWLCEECQLKDNAEKKKQRPTETTPLSTPLSEKENKNDVMNSENPFSRHKKLRISTDCAIYASLPPPSPHKSFRDVISPGKFSNFSRENSVKTEIGSSKELISPRKTSNLSRENSMKMEICSLKGSSGGQTMKKSHVLSRSYSLSHVSSLRDVEKGQAEMHPPKGTITKHLTKHPSFKNPSMKPEVKSMTESNPTKQKTSYFSPSKPTDGARPFRRLIKSASLKEASSSCANNSSVKLTKPLSPTVRVNTQMRTEREKSSVEKKDFKGENRTDVLAQQHSTIVKKFEYKAKRSVPKKTECGSSCSHLETAPGEEKNKTVVTKQQEANKNPRSIPASKESDKKFNRLKTAVKTVPPEARDGGNNGISDKLKVPLPKCEISHIGKNQKATSINVDEHSKSTSSDKIRVEKVSKNEHLLASSLKIEESADLNVISPNVGVEKMKAPKDMLSQSSLLDKEKMDDTNLNKTAARVEKPKVPKDTLAHARSLASSLKIEESVDLNVITPNVGAEKMKAPKDMLSQSSSLDKEKMDDTNLNKTAARVEKTKALKDTLAHARSLEKPLNSNGISAHVKNVEVKPYMPGVFDSSLLRTPSETMVIPEEDFVWQGSFEILRAKTQASESFKGVQAHFSTHVSPKVCEVVAKFSDKLKLEEVPWNTAWPMQFQKIEPSEEHVALFFFARDLESYEASYSRLLQSLIGDNLALRGDIFGAELLIFPSDKLPKRSQRWNSLLYLWGIFRAQRQVPSKTISNSPKPVRGPSGNFPTKINEDVKLCKELTIGDNLPKAKVEDGAGSLDLGPEHCKMPVEQNASTCLGPGAFRADRGSLNASHACCTTQIYAVKPEDANEKMASLPILQRKMAENISDVDGKTLSLEKPTDSELKPGNKQAYLSDKTSSEELGLKRKREHDGSQTETGHKSSTLLKKLASPKIHPSSIDLEKPAETDDVYGTEDVEGTSLRNAGQPRTGSRVINAILSDDEDAAENKMPNLNLALGNKNPSQKEVRPLPLFPLVWSKEVDSHASLSLSLTIAPPGLEEGMESPVVKTQQFLPEKPGEKAPLRLFGGYINP